jgi:hypothetical protein
VNEEFEDDGPLLVLSWKTMCSLCPSLASSLKGKHSQLVSDVAKYIDIVEIRNANIQQQIHNQTFEYPATVSESLNFVEPNVKTPLRPSNIRIINSRTQIV